MMTLLRWLGDRTHTASGVAIISIMTRSAHAQTPRHIDPDPATGRSAAVVVPAEATLLHTRQLLPAATLKMPSAPQAEELLDQLAALLKTHQTERARVVKVNFVLAEDQARRDVETALARLAGKSPPAVSFVAGRLPVANAKVALDAVIALSTPVRPKSLVTQDGDALLPAGTRVWISGQAEKGSDLADATRKTMAGLRDSLKFVGLKDSAIVQLKAFVQPMADVAVVRKEMAAFFGDQPVPPMVFVEWKSSLPIEIELIAWGGPERAGEAIEYLTPPALKPSPVFSRIARVNYGKLIYLSGIDPARGDTPGEQVADAFDALGAVLKKAGSDYRHLAKATYYVTGADTVKKMGELRPRYYDPKRPPAASLAMVQGTGRAGKSVTLDMIAVPPADVDINDYGPPEHGHGLTDREAAAGWISLFDGKTTFGWKNASVDKGVLSGGVSHVALRDYELKVDVARPGALTVGGLEVRLDAAGTKTLDTAGIMPLPIALQSDLAVRSLAVRPKTQPLWNGNDLAGWKRIDRPKLPPERRPSWTIEKGLLRAVGGPGALEHDQRFADGVFQIEARMNVRYANGGFFFRAIPGDFMNGYEAQLYNRCLDNDPAKPATWATGAIDDRQNARRLVSRDGAFFVMTVIAHAPHIATWINGHQTVAWTDTRAPHQNPRQGKRLEAGALQLQAHDAGTDISFRKIAAAAW
jgi:enamine deaminase RidA (YjgF/YER057c/UK114 family)